jgi:excinuclease ABC subunit C
MRGITSADIVGWHTQADITAINIMFIRAEKLAGNYSFVAENSDDLIATFLGQMYLKYQKPKELVLASPIEDQAVLAEALALPVSVPVRGARKNLAATSVLNASEALERKVLSQHTFKDSMQALGAWLGLAKLHRVEIYDNSHIQGTSAVGAMVVATEQGFDKRSYRRFNLDTPGVGGDDIASMQEVLTRRLKHGAFPDLAIIDGGPAQYNIASAILGDSTHVISLAESEPPSIYCASGNIPAAAIPKSILLFMERLRDEAHRFAVGSNRARRARQAFNSDLDSAPGIGPAKKRALLEHFGSFRAIKAAAVNELAQVEGLSTKLAKNLYDFLHE